MKSNSPHALVPDALQVCRDELDRLDEELIRLVAKRLDLGLRAAQIKRDAGLPIIDTEREEKVIAQARGWARDASVSEEQVADIFRRLVSLSGEAQLKSV